ncbi:MAG: hypothetical protein WBO49_02655 [Candidatus Saccharimonas sp.]
MKTTIKSAKEPGQLSGVIGFMFAFMGLGPIGLILSIISTLRSRPKSGARILGIIGIIFNILTCLALLFFFGYIIPSTQA